MKPSSQKKDLIVIDGKKYISSRRAAEIAGYSADYVGQLCRSGKLERRMVGRLWYVDEGSLLRHQAESFKANQTSFRSPNAPGPSKPIESVPVAPIVSSQPALSAAALMPLIPLAPGASQAVPLTWKHISLRVGGAVLASIAVFMAARAALLVAPTSSPVASVQSAFSSALKAIGSLFSNSAPADDGFLPDTEAQVAAAAGAGVVVVPSQGAALDAKLEQSIRNSFSDEVTMRTAPGGTAGIITPVFRTVKGHDYLYVLVPVNTASTTK